MPQQISASVQGTEQSVGLRDIKGFAVNEFEWCCAEKECTCSTGLKRYSGVLGQAHLIVIVCCTELLGFQYCFFYRHR